MQKATLGAYHEAALFMVQRYGVLAALQAQECARTLIAAGLTGEATQWFKIQEAICKLPN